MFKVKLPIFWHTDKTRQFEELGIESKAEDEFAEYEQREIIFYQISGITKYQNEEKYTRVYSNGDMFICSLPINDVENKIDDANK